MHQLRAHFHEHPKSRRFDHLLPSIHLKLLERADAILDHMTTETFTNGALKPLAYALNILLQYAVKWELIAKETEEASETEDQDPPTSLLMEALPHLAAQVLAPEPARPEPESPPEPSEQPAPRMSALIDGLPPHQANSEDAEPFSPPPPPEELNGNPEHRMSLLAGQRRPPPPTDPELHSPLQASRQR